jgi:dihydrofolate reductase/thymidylate synthase
LIANVVNYKNKLAIGRDNGLLFRLKEDLKYFQHITTHNLNSNSKLDKNVVVMGRKTWFSIPREKRPLKNRINLVLTNDKDLIKLSPYPTFPWTKLDNSVYFINYDQLLKFYKKYTPNMFIIGGSKIYNLFLNNPDIKLKPNKIFLTEVYNYIPEIGVEPDTFMDHFDQSYKLVGVSDKKHDPGYDLHFRFLEYRHYPNYITEEAKYIKLAKDILENGNERSDRTGVGTISSFGHQLHFDISQSIPLLTTKRVQFKGIVEELLFFCRGDTDSKLLDAKNVKIWNGNTTRDFLDNRGLHFYDQGIMGPMYGFMWRNFGGKYSQAFADTSKIDLSKIGGFDQLSHVEHLLKTDPFSRRIYISNLNPEQSDKMVLEPCHVFFQLYVTEENGQKYLSGHFLMRSNDFGCGFPFNITSYTILIYLLALRCNMKPKEIVYSCSDVHIYKNHITQIQQQFTRTPRPFPRLKVNDNVKYKDWSEIQYTDFDLIGYFPYPGIKMEMAI